MKILVQFKKGTNTDQFGDFMERVLDDPAVSHVSRLRKVAYIVWLKEDQSADDFMQRLDDRFKEIIELRKVTERVA